MNKQEFYWFIEHTLTEHPDWLESAINAISSGMETSLKKLRERQSRIDAAFLCALGLLEPNRISQKLKDFLNGNIVEKINMDRNITPTEEKFLKSIKENNND